MANPKLEIIETIIGRLRTHGGLKTYFPDPALISEKFLDNSEYPRILVTCSLVDSSSHTYEGYQGEVWIYVFTRSVEGIGIGENIAAEAQEALQNQDLGLSGFSTLVFRFQSTTPGAFLGDGLTYRVMVRFQVWLGNK